MDGMAAEDNLNPQQFYHGTSTRLGVGNTIQPASNVGQESIYSNGMGHDVETYAHATPDLGSAVHYAQRDMQERGRPHLYVYRVTPMGDTEPDPADPNAIRSQSPMRIDAAVSPIKRQIAHREYLRSI